MKKERFNPKDYKIWLENTKDQRINGPISFDEMYNIIMDARREVYNEKNQEKVNIENIYITTLYLS